LDQFNELDVSLHSTLNETAEAINSTKELVNKKSAALDALLHTENISFSIAA
jgi:hypothetical protein